MKWSIVADTSCDLFRHDIANDQVDFVTVPFSIHIGEDVYIDDESLDPAVLVDQMEKCREVPHTACPAPGLWADAFKKAENSVAITISGALSASLHSAQNAKKMVLEEDGARNVLVLDSKSTGPGLALCIWKLRSWLCSGGSFESVSEKASAFLSHTHTVFALSSFNNLVKNGRMNRIVGFIAHKLGMWGIGIGGKRGEIQMKGTTRGPAGAISMILEEMSSKSFQGGEVAISHCQNERMAMRLREKILERWSTADVSVLTTRGLDSFYAERGGVIVAFIS